MQLASAATAAAQQPMQGLHQVGDAGRPPQPAAVVSAEPHSWRGRNRRRVLLLTLLECRILSRAR
jgi:hypothetical protein